MAQVIDVDAGNKRRLPTWMLRVNASDKLRKSEHGDEKSSVSEEQPEIQDMGSKIKSIARKQEKSWTSEIDTTERKETLQTCEAKQRIRKVTRRNEHATNSVSNGEARKRFRKETAGGEQNVRKSVGPRKQNKMIKRPTNCDTEVVSPGRSEEEIDVTLDDLISIAEEYVNADKEKRCEWSATGESTSETNPLGLSISSKDDMREPFQATSSSQILSKCETISCSSHLTETYENKQENPTTESSDTNVTRTGDAAQDMLDLFLGPLLKKHPPKEQDLGSLATAGFPSVHESTKQALRRAGFEDEAPVTKKKSSLKDKVSMFLD